MISSLEPKTNLQLTLSQMDRDFEAFRQAYPAYDTTWILDELRLNEYARLDRQGHV